MRFICGYGLGDELMLTAWVREYKKAFPDEMVRLANPRRDLWLGNPWINYGNGENGLTVDLVKLTPASFKRQYPLRQPGSFMGHYPRGIVKDFGFELKDTTPEIFLTPEEIAVEHWAPSGRPVVAIDSSAGWTSRLWVPERWQDVASRLIDEGWDVLELGADTKGSPRAPVPHTHSFLERHTIRESASVLRRCDVYLGNDSGLFHLAAAVGTPQVIVFGRVRHEARAYSTTVSMEGRPCFEACGMACTATWRQGFAHCTQDVTVDQVVAAVQQARTLRAPKESACAS